MSIIMTIIKKKKKREQDDDQVFGFCWTMGRQVYLQLLSQQERETLKRPKEKETEKGETRTEN